MNSVIGRLQAVPKNPDPEYAAKRMSVRSKLYLKNIFPMNKNLSVLPVLIAIFLLGSCVKTTTPTPCTPQTVASEEPTIVAYGTSNGYNLTRDSTGVYYEITNPGTGASPTINSNVYVTYTGKLLNNTIFDRQADATQTGWALSNLIRGWQIALPKLKKGGSMRVLIPSSLGYGCQAVGAIPSNSILYFDITLVNFQ
jgi:FKBP-type peptidyl-prolyl cis-trans isomerase FkpA